MTFDLEGLRIEFENYEYGVKHVIPSSLAEEVDGAFTDELMNILHARSYLERELFLQPESQELAEYKEKLGQLDSLLYAKRGIL